MPKKEEERKSERIVKKDYQLSFSCDLWVWLMFVIYGCIVFEDGDEIILVLVCKQLMIQREIGMKGREGKKNSKESGFRFVFFLVEMFLRQGRKEAEKKSKESGFVLYFFQSNCFFFLILWIRIKLEFLFFYLNNVDL